MTGGGLEDQRKAGDLSFKRDQSQEGNNGRCPRPQSLKIQLDCRVGHLPLSVYVCVFCIYYF